MLLNHSHRYGPEAAISHRLHHANPDETYVVDVPQRVKPIEACASACEFRSFGSACGTERIAFYVLASFACLGLIMSSAPASAADVPLRFNRDVRPILTEACYHCHGPDKNTREADLRLDVPEAAYADRGGYAAIVRGDVEHSELVARITSDDESMRMPPHDSEKRLSPAQVKTLKRWVAEGAAYEPHWSFAPVTRPALPSVESAAWPVNEIDHFVLERLAREKLVPSAEADKTKLIRRVTLDLTGLPPTLEEIDAFLADTSDGAYERVVDRLLASPRYGERMARVWLDYARYADTNGYQNDGQRDMYRWRDWVIEAFNRNMPFDQFTVEQLAGDLLPGATLDQRIATGFNRNHRANSEGGIIPEEWLVEYVADRTETTAAVWMGVTIGCARCHDHKYDPFMQKDYYRLFAMFNNVPELGRVVLQGNSPPVVKAPTADMSLELARLERRAAAAKGRVDDLANNVVVAQRAWEATAQNDPRLDWGFDEDLVVHLPLDDASEALVAAATVDAAVEAVINPETGANSSAVPLGKPEFVAGRIGGAAKFDGKSVLVAGDVGNFKESDAFSVAAFVYYDDVAASGTIIARTDEENSSRGYELDMVDGRLRFRLIARVLDDLLLVETRRPIGRSGQWRHVVATYNGSKTGRGVRLYVDGEPAAINDGSTVLNNPTSVEMPLRVGARPGGTSFRGLIDDVRIYDRVLKPDDVEALASAESIVDILQIAPRDRSRQQARKLAQFFLKNHAPAEIRGAFAALDDAQRERDAFEAAIPTVMVMEEMAEPRATHVLERGDYAKPRERVGPDVPGCLPPLAEGQPANRLGLARWLVDARNPLTARVAVNRFWQLFFPVGLVKTSEDFGTQGEWPSHPELLDWLAAEFVDSGWDVKALVKTIVMSATYRQSSEVTGALVARDPENRLLARGPRFRLSAEVIRDQALAIGGLLVEKFGGPSVKPYQPVGLWEELTTLRLTYDQSSGSDLYRRSLYTYWKRTIPPPSMMTFDAAGRELCTVRTLRTNTPLQALSLLNEVTYVEAARALAERMLREGGSSPLEQVTYGFRLATARRPTDDELAVLVSSYEDQRAGFAARPKAAKELLAFGESKRDTEIEAACHAAMTTVAGVILNLDEVITKE